MASLVIPPTRPYGFPKTRRGGKHYWTIHTHPNQAFTVKVNDEAPTAIVGFKDPEDAVVIGKMLETHYMLEKEWPDTYGKLRLPEPRADMDLVHLYFRKWDFEDLKVTCTKNFLSMVAIDDIESTKKGFEFNGKMYSFEAPTEFYIGRLMELYDME